MAVIKEYDSGDGKVGNFWFISEETYDDIIKVMTYKVSLYFSVQSFEQGKAPIKQYHKTYKGNDYFINGDESDKLFKMKCYDNLKVELGGGFDYPTDEEDWCPKIYKFIKQGVPIKHFHDINYTIELTVNLCRVDTFAEKGLLTKVEYYTDTNKTDKLLEFNRTYVHNPVDGLISKHTTRIYINVDGTPNAEVKDLGEYVYTKNQGRKATTRRRDNIILNIEEKVIDLIKENSPPEEILNNMILASEFVSQISTAKNSFISSGNPMILMQTIMNPDMLITYPFLSWSLLEFDTVVDFMIDQLTY